MPFILRKIRKNRWYKYEKNELPWLSEGDVQADPLGDLATTKNELSVWQIENDKSNLEQVIAALRANCDDIANIDFALFDSKFLKDIKVAIRRSHGGSKDEMANSIWHYDLFELSAFKLIELTKVIIANAEISRFPEKTVLRLIARSVIRKHIERTQLTSSPKIAAKVDTLLVSEGAT